MYFIIGDEYISDEKLRLYKNVSINDLPLSSLTRKKLLSKGYTSIFDIVEVFQSNKSFSECSPGMKKEIAIVMDYFFVRKNEVDYGKLEPRVAFVFGIAHRLLDYIDVNNARLYGILLDIAQNDSSLTYEKVWNLTPESDFVLRLFDSGFFRSAISSHIKMEVSSIKGGEPFPVIFMHMPDFLKNEMKVKNIIDELCQNNKLFYSAAFGCYTNDNLSDMQDKIIIPNILRRVFHEDFYLPSELETEFKRLFPDSRYDIFDETIIGFIGLTKHSTYYLRKEYDKPSKYFKNLILSKEKIAESMFPQGMWEIQPFKTQLMKLVSSLNVIKMDDTYYLTAEKLQNAGITRDILKQFARQVRDDMSDGSIFSIHSYMNEHNPPELLSEYDFSNTFYENILLQMGYFTSGRFEKVNIFRVGEDPIDNIWFLRQVIQQNSQGKGYLDVYNLCQLLTEKYGIEIDMTKMIRIASRTDNSLYYDKFTDCIFCSKHTYLNDSFWEKEN